MSNPLQNVLGVVALMVPTCPRVDPSEGFSDYDRVAYEAQGLSCGVFGEDVFGDECDDEVDPSGGYEDDYDGQPSEYDEWQDYMGGDDWDHGQCDEY